MSTELRAEIHGLRGILYDPEDASRVEQHTWSDNGSGYAQANVNGKVTRLHRFLLGPDGENVDHINGNRLDNRRCNLRIVTVQINGANRKGANRNSASGVRGVGWDAQRQKWKAQAKYGERRVMKRFDSREEAERFIEDFWKSIDPLAYKDKRWSIGE